jgi:hypothetical protein
MALPPATLHVLGDRGENMTEQTTLSDYQAIGGGPAVRAVVEDLYTRVLSDRQLAPFFAGVSWVGPTPTPAARCPTPTPG